MNRTQFSSIITVMMIMLTIGCTQEKTAIKFLMRLFCWLLFCACSLQAQTWQRSYSTEDSLLPLRNIINTSVVWDNYIYSSQPFSEYTVGYMQGSTRKFRLLKLDMNGTLVDSSEYFNSTIANLRVYNNKLIAKKNSVSGDYIAVFNSNLDLIDSVYFTGLSFYTIQQFGDDSLKMNCHASNGDLYLQTYDPNLNLINQQIVPYPSILAIDSAAPLYGLSHLYQFPDSKNYWLGAMHKQYLLDSNFVPIQTMQYPTQGTPPILNHATTIAAIQTDAGNVISTSRYRYSFWNGHPNDYYYMSVRKWHDMTVIDSVNLTHLAVPDTQIDVSQTCISRIDRSTFYSAIGSGLVLPHAKILVAKMDTSLNVHWFKTFEHPDKNFVFYEILATQDGGALISGTIFNWVTKDDAIGYLMKIDSSGNILTSSDPLMRIEKAFICYPNPAQHDIYFSAQQETHPLDIQIFDTQGTLVYSEQNVTQTHIALESWTKGLYVYQVRCQGKTSSGKFVLTP